MGTDDLVVTRTDATGHGSWTAAGCLLIALAALAMTPAVASADPYRSPGGPLPLSHGGNNQAPFPPLATVGVAEPPAAPVSPLAVSGYPNPARGTMRFRASAPPGAEVRVRLFGVNGRLVQEWRQTAGTRPIEWTWNGRDLRGRPAGAGIFFYRADAGGRRVEGRLVMLSPAK